MTQVSGETCSRIAASRAGEGQTEVKESDEAPSGPSEAGRSPDSVLGWERQSRGRKNE